MSATRASRWAIQKREPFLCFQDHRTQPGFLKRIAARQALFFIKCFPFADERKGKMRQRRQVSARPDGALFRDDRSDPAIEELAEQFDHFQANAAQTEHEDVRAEQSHRPHFWNREWITDAAGVAPDKVQLQLSQLSRRDMHVRQLAKARADAINHPAPRDDTLDNLPRVVDGGVRGAGHLDHHVAKSYLRNLRKRQGTAGQLHGSHLME